MKKLLIGISVLLLNACQKDAQAPATAYTDCVSTDVMQDLISIEGRIEKLASFYVIQVADRRYAVCNLPDSMKVQGKLLVFDAHELRTPPNVRLAGTPIILTKIY